jgi:hypothetical protein
MVGSGSGGNNPVTGFTLNAHAVAVWQVVGSIPAPEVGSIGPTLAQPGVKVTIAGQGKQRRAPAAAGALRQCLQEGFRFREFDAQFWP